MEKSTLINGEALGASLEVTLVIEQFLNETYRFRRNILNGKVEFAILPKADETAESNTAGNSSSLSSGLKEADLVFRPLTPEALNSIVRRAKKEQICVKGSPKTEITEFVHSDDVQIYNPIGDYLEKSVTTRLPVFKS